MISRLIFALLMTAFLVGPYCPAQAATELIQNGGFEDSSILPTFWQIISNSITGDISLAVNDPLHAHTGNNYVTFAGVHPADTTPTILGQTIQTVPGANYILSFAIEDVLGRAGDVFKATLGGFSVSFTGDQANGAYAVETVMIDGSFVPPPTNSYDLQFQGIGENLGAGGGTVWFLDDVSLTTVVPIPPALPLFASGLVGLVLLGWRRKKKTAA